MSSRLSLRMFKGTAEVGVETFERGIIKIGRLPSAHLKLDDPRVSRIHAVIEVDEESHDVSVIDMGSAEGTFVNGEKVTKVVLKEGDEIRLGDTRLILELPAEDGEVTVVATPAALGVAAAGDDLASMATMDSPGTDDVAAEPATEASTDTVIDGVAYTDSSEDGWFKPAPVMAAAMLAPGVAGNSLVPPMPDAPSAEWYDPYGEYSHVVVEPEEQVSGVHRSLEIATSWEDQLLDVRHFEEPAKVTMGEKKCDIFVVSEGLPDVEFPIIRFMDGDYVLTYFDGLEGTVDVEEQRTPLASLGGQPDGDYPASYQYVLPLNSVTNVQYGGLNLQMRFVAPPALVATSIFESINYNWLNIFLVSLFLHTGFFATTALYPYDTRSLEEDLFSSNNRFAQFILNPPEKQKNDLLNKLLKGKEGASSAKHAGDEGKAGKKDAKDTGKRMASKSEVKTDEMIVQAKMNQLFGKNGGGGVGTVFGGGLGGDLVGALGGVTGDQIGDSYGFGGLGLRGHGPGGGGSSTRTFGVGNIGTRGRGGGSAGYGSGAGGLGGKSDRAVNISQGAPVIMGSLDKEIIRRVIRENIGQIRYCYERELARTAGLYGKILVKFIIAATGSVSNSQVVETTMNNSAVESCIANKVRGWRFPKPRGGGIVIVTYPFIFKQSG